MLKEYIRNKKGNPIGVMISENMAGTIEFGYSLCNKKDTYNKKRGFEIALNRLYNPKFLNFPDSLQEQYNRFALRSKKYFKDAKLIETEEELDELKRSRS